MAKRKKRPAGHGKKPDSPWLGMNAVFANGEVYGKITNAYEYGAGEVVDILKPDGKTDMLPVKDEFLLLSQDKKSFIVQNFEFIVAEPEK